MSLQIKIFWVVLSAIRELLLIHQIFGLINRECRLCKQDNKKINPLSHSPMVKKYFAFQQELLTSKI